jgi:hypothetical protein
MCLLVIYEGQWTISVSSDVMEENTSCSKNVGISSKISCNFSAVSVMITRTGYIQWNNDDALFVLDHHD